MNFFLLIIPLYARTQLAEREGIIKVESVLVNSEVRFCSQRRKGAVLSFSSLRLCEGNPLLVEAEEAFNC